MTLNFHQNHKWAHTTNECVYPFQLYIICTGTVHYMSLLILYAIFTSLRYISSCISRLRFALGAHEPTRSWNAYAYAMENAYIEDRTERCNVIRVCRYVDTGMDDRRPSPTGTHYALMQWHEAADDDKTKRRMDERMRTLKNWVKRNEKTIFVRQTTQRERERGKEV